MKKYFKAGLIEIWVWMAVGILISAISRAILG